MFLICFRIHQEPDCMLDTQRDMLQPMSLQEPRYYSDTTSSIQWDGMHLDCQQNNMLSKTKSILQYPQQKMSPDTNNNSKISDLPTIEKEKSIRQIQHFINGHNGHLSNSMNTTMIMQPKKPNQ